MSSPPPESRSPAAVIKHHLLEMVGAVLILNAIAIPLFYLLHLNQRPGTSQNIYIVIWMLLSAGIVVVQRRKIRRAQIAAIRGSGTSDVRR